MKTRFVCALSKETVDTVLFKSYSSRESSDMYHKTRIWETARVTSVASFFFDPIKIDQFEEEFVDETMRANNLVAQLWNEIKSVWSNEALERNIKCLIFIDIDVSFFDQWVCNYLFSVIDSLQIFFLTCEIASLHIFSNFGPSVIFQTVLNISRFASLT
jgi:hypothetical protein